MIDPLYFWEDDREATLWKVAFILPLIEYMDGLVDPSLALQDMIFCSGVGAFADGGLGFQGQFWQLKYEEKVYITRVVQRRHGGFIWEVASSLGITGVDNLEIGIGGRTNYHSQEPIHME